MLDQTASTNCSFYFIYTVKRLLLGEVPQLGSDADGEKGFLLAAGVPPAMHRKGGVKFGRGVGFVSGTCLLPPLCKLNNSVSPPVLSNPAILGNLLHSLGLGTQLGLRSDSATDFYG